MNYTLVNKILITGISGFVGANLSKYLKNKEKDIIGVSRQPKGKNEIDYKNLNIQVLNSTKSFIHLAGKAHDFKKTTNEKAYFEGNTALTKKVFNQFLESDCEIFIYMSSVKAAADTVTGVLDETVIPNPITAYGKSKLAAEQYILSQKIPAQKRVYILRPCMIHGPNNKGNLNLLYSFVSKGIPYPLGNYQNNRSFVSVENLCFVIKELIENSTIENGVYNVADDEALSTNNLVKHIGTVIQKPSNVWNVPKVLITILAKIGDFIPLPINSERLTKLTENYVISNKKIKKAMGKELPLSVTEGIRKTILSFQ